MAEQIEQVKVILEHFRKMNDIDNNSYMAGINAEKNLNKASEQIVVLFTPQEQKCSKRNDEGVYLDPNGRTAGDCPICNPHEVGQEELREKIADIVFELEEDRDYHLKQADQILALIDKDQKAYVKLEPGETVLHLK